MTKPRKGLGHHHSHNHQPSHLHITRAFVAGLIFNAVFTIGEFIAAFLSGSLALWSDATHNLGDVGVLVLSLVGLKLAHVTAKPNYTYGYRKASILASLVSSVLLLVISINIIVEAVDRFLHPSPVLGNTVIFVATAGIVVNGISALFFFRGAKHEVNARGAYLHLMADALVSLGVVVTGMIIKYTGWQLADPIASMLVAVVIVASTIGLLKESVRLTLDGVPEGIDKETVRKVMMQNPHVKNAVHLHIWAMSTTEFALTAHLQLKNENYTMFELTALKTEIRKELAKLRIGHATIEVDSKSA